MAAIFICIYFLFFIYVTHHTSIASGVTDERTNASEFTLNSFKLVGEDDLFLRSETLEIRSIFKFEDEIRFHRYFTGKYIQNIQLDLECESRLRNNDHMNVSENIGYVFKLCDKSVRLQLEVEINQNNSPQNKSHVDNDNVISKDELSLVLILNVSQSNIDHIAHLKTQQLNNSVASNIIRYPNPILDEISQKVYALKHIYVKVLLPYNNQWNDSEVRQIQKEMRTVKPIMKIHLADLTSERWIEEKTNNNTHKNSVLARLLKINATKGLRIYGKWNRRKDRTVELVSPFILSSGYGCQIKFRIIYRNTAAFVLKIISNNLTHVAAHEDFPSNFELDTGPKWKTIEIDLGKIEHPFQLRLHMTVGIAGVDNILLQNCGDRHDDIKPVCMEDEYQCNTGACIKEKRVCDLTHDCLFGDDELEEDCAGKFLDKSRCNFESGSCAMIQEFTGCSRNEVKAFTVGLISDHTLHSDTGGVLYVDSENCDRGGFRTVEYIKPSYEVQRNSSCMLSFAYYLDDYGYASILVKVCQMGTCNQTAKISDKNVNKDWKSMNIPIRGISSSYFYIEFEFRFVVGRRLYLDDIYLNTECFESQALYNESTYLKESFGVVRSQGEVLSKPAVNEKMKLFSYDIIIALACVFGAIIAGSIITITVLRKARKAKKRGIQTFFTESHQSKKDTVILPTKTGFKIDVTQLAESSPLMKKLEEALAETNWAYSPSTDSQTKPLRNIPRCQLNIMSDLGKGVFGQVQMGVFSDPRVNVKKNVAIKRLHALATDEAKADLLLEALTLSQFHHPNIVSCLGISNESGSLLLVLELLEGGDLKKFLRGHRPSDGCDPVLKISDLLHLAVDVAKGCLHLEQTKFIHRDIAARNCLLTKTGPGMVAKVADFGLAREMILSNYYRKSGHARLPVRWMPPEAFLDGIFSHKSDVWAYGVLLWEIFSYAYLPYPGMSNDDVMFLVPEGKRLSAPTGCPVLIYSLMSNCWNTVPGNRPSFENIVEQLMDIEKDMVKSPDSAANGASVAQRRLNSYAMEESDIVSPLLE